MPDLSKRDTSRKRGPVPIFSRKTSEQGTGSPVKKRESRNKKHLNHSHHTHAGAHARQQSQPATLAPSSKYALAIMGQPPNLVPAGYPFQPSVLVSKRISSSSRSSSNILAVASLLSAHSQSNPAPLPPGILRGQRLCSSVHDLPSDYRARLPGDLKSAALGYVSFPDLTITHPGSFKIRVSLLRMPDARTKSRDIETLLSVDSQTFQVYSHPQFSGQCF